MSRFLVGLLIVGTLAVPSTARASWTSKNCFSSHYADGVFRRSEARAYAEVARSEGYEYAGGCWNDDDVDDTPQQPDSSGEGPDCSGLVFKSWELRAAAGASGGTYWGRVENIHGPYASYDFHSPVATDPFYRLPNKNRVTTVYMDAFARNGHVGMIYTNAGTSANTDYIIEALCDLCGTNVFEETYRSDSDYLAARREGWTADCYPRCQAPGAAQGVVVVP